MSRHLLDYIKPPFTEPGRVAGKFGKASPRCHPAIKDFEIYHLKGGLNPAPPEFFGQTGVKVLPMDDNDKYGICTIAGYDHGYQCLDQQAGKPSTALGPTICLQAYSKLSGCTVAQMESDPQDYDQGLIEANVLKYAHLTGIGGKKLAAYGSIHPQHVGVLKQVIAQYGGLYVGIQVPQNAMSQFQNGEEWTLTANNGQIVGGHCVWICGYDKTNAFYCVTWGAVQKMSLQWWLRYADEAWALVPTLEGARFNVPALTTDLAYAEAA